MTVDVTPSSLVVRRESFFATLTSTLWSICGTRVSGPCNNQSQPFIDSDVHNALNCYQLQAFVVVLSRERQAFDYNMKYLAMETEHNPLTTSPFQSCTRKTRLKCAYQRFDMIDSNNAQKNFTEIVLCYYSRDNLLTLTHSNVETFLGIYYEVTSDVIDI